VYFYKYPLPPGEGRARESNKDKLLVLISPHPSLLPGGEGIINKKKYPRVSLNRKV
jgi:hypothetical protein